MLNRELDDDLEQVLERDVDDLARYNILLHLNDRPDVSGDVQYFADALGLRSPDRVTESLEALARCSLLIKMPAGSDGNCTYGLNPDPATRRLVDRLCNLRHCSCYGEIVERLAARSLRRAKQAQVAGRNGRSNGQH